MDENLALAPLPQRKARGLALLCRFRRSRDPAAAVGKVQSILCLARRSCNRRSPGGAALEFAANIGNGSSGSVDLVKFNDAGEMTEFEVMIRPIKALQAQADEIRNRIGPRPSQMTAAAAPGTDFGRFWWPTRLVPRLRAREACGKDRPAL